MKTIIQVLGCAVCLIIVAIAPFHLEKASAATETRRPFSSPQDLIHIDHEINQTTGNLTVCISGTQKDISFKVSKDGVHYVYKLSPEETASLPLTMGDGEYFLEATLYITLTKGEIFWKKTIEVMLEDELSPYLAASKIVNWTQSMELVTKAKSLANGLDDASTALGICSYIANEYHYQLSDIAPPSNYIPNLEEVYRDGKGFCYDLAALYAAMCRSVGIPCKLVMGYSAYIGVEKYHAWCQVNIDGLWYTVDPTYSMGRGSSFLDASGVTATKYY